MKLNTRHCSAIKLEDGELKVMNPSDGLVELSDSIAELVDRVPGNAVILASHLYGAIELLEEVGPIAKLLFDLLLAELGDLEVRLITVLDLSTEEISLNSRGPEFDLSPE